MKTFKEYKYLHILKSIQEEMLHYGLQAVIVSPIFILNFSLEDLILPHQ